MDALTHTTRLYLGLTRPDGTAIDCTSFDTFRDSCICALFPGGFTIEEGTGGWRDTVTGETIQEPVAILEVAHNNGHDARDRLKAVAEAYKLDFAQQAVMATTVAAEVEFI